MSVRPKVNIVVALPSEAAPLRAAFGLRQVRERPFRVHEGESHRVVISGVGAHLAAAAVGFLGGCFPDSGDQLWLNIGVAGHASAKPGTLFIAHKVTDQVSGQTWYPCIDYPGSSPTADVLTVPSVCENYPIDTCCEMEAAGFMSAVNRLTMADNIQVLKIVSDNRDNPVSEITRELIQQLVTENIEGIEQICRALSERLIDRAPRWQGLESSELATIYRNWRFTSAQTQQMRDRVSRWYAITDGEPIIPLLNDCRSADQALVRLGDAISSHLPLKKVSP